MVGLMMISSSAFSETSIRIVDLQKIMQTANDGKEIQAKLEKEFKPRRDKLIAMEKDIKKDMATFKRDNAVMSKAKKEALEKKIVAAQRQFEQEGQAYQKDLNQAHNAEMETFYGKIRAAIDTVSKKEHYDLVLQKDAAPFSNDSLEITDLVLKAMN